MNDNVNDNDVSDDDDDDDDDDDHDEQNYKIKQLNNYFKAIDETKSFEEQKEILKKEISQMNIGMMSIIMTIKN